MGRLSACRRRLCLLRQRGLHSAPCLGCPPRADNSTLRSARSIFGDVHAAENDWNLFRGCGRETLQGFFDRLKPPRMGRLFTISHASQNLRRQGANKCNHFFRGRVPRKKIPLAQQVCPQGAHRRAADPIGLRPGANNKKAFTAFLLKKQPDHERHGHGRQHRAYEHALGGVALVTSGLYGEDRRYHGRRGGGEDDYDA